MHIQKINPFINFNHNIKNSNIQEIPETNSNSEYSTNPLNIAFEARVDKGLIRFCEFNAGRMPTTVKNYIETLPDKASKTPMQVQAEAFAALAGAATAGAIKTSLPDEELFQNLKEPEETKATRGILGIFRENKELLNLCGQSILANKENFTVWLVKKVFLEGKTLEEINQDFDREIDADFLALYNQKNYDKSEKELIHSSTLKALGIKLPEFEYLQSLRYTRDGYSDFVGEKISQAQRDFWDSMPLEERTARARKSVQKFENWWNSMSRDQQLDMIAFQIDELEMLKRFNSSDIGKTRTVKKVTEPKTQTENKHDKVNVDSTLSRDDLFKIWASNNLKLFEANLTEFDKRRIETKREQRRAEWWNSMSSKERTEYINKLRTSTEPLRFAMIDAWNKNPDILVELSHTLKKNHFNKPTEILYGTEEFNQFMSQVMTEFWESHPDFAERMGESIRESHDKIKDSINNGKFEFLKRDIYSARTKREKETIEAVKNYREILTEEEYNNYPQYMQDFIDTYSKSPSADVNTLPAKYLKEYYEIIQRDLSEKEIISWTKAIKQEPLDFQDMINIKKIRDLENPRTEVIHRALEATLADILYECTQNPQVYLMSHADCKLAMKQITSGREAVTVYSNKTGLTFNFPILKRDIDVKKIDKLYDSYMEPLPENAADTFLDQFFTLNFGKIQSREEISDIVDFLISYVEGYMGSNRILFGEDRLHTPECKAMFAEKFLRNLPPEFDTSMVKLKVHTADDFLRENKIYRIDNLMRKKYRFLPDDAFNMYIYELNKIFRGVNLNKLEHFEEVCCKTKKTGLEAAEVILMDRNQFSATHMVYVLCIEQALADVLYESCKNEEVYALQLEELLSNIESTMAIKNFPMKEKWNITTSSLDHPIEISLKYRIQPYQIEKRFREYYNEVTNYLQECITEKQAMTKEDLLYILNPDENKTKIDELTMKRINNSVPDRLLTDEKDSSSNV